MAPWPPTCPCYMCVNTKMMAIIVLVVVVPHAKYIHSNLFQVNGWPLYKRKKDQMIKMVKQRKKNRYKMIMMKLMVDC